MSPDDLILTGLVANLGLSLLVVAYLRRPLLDVLQNYCGNSDRARFWAAASHVIIVLLPLAVHLISLAPPPPEEMTPQSIILDRLKYGVPALITAVLVVSGAIGLFGRAGALPVWVGPDQVDNLNRLLYRVQELRARELISRANAGRHG
jgi:hypothetical protein